MFLMTHVLTPGARRLALVAALLAAVGALAGCSSGAVTPTVPTFSGQHVDAATFAQQIMALDPAADYAV